MADNMKVNVIFKDGSSREVIISTSALALVKRLPGPMPSLFEGTGFSLFGAEVANIVAITRSDHDFIRDDPVPRRKAAFRLGQLDMQASVCDMLRQLADGAADPVSAGLILAADLVESMEVPDANS